MKKQPFLNADIQIAVVNLDIRGSSRNEWELFLYKERYYKYGQFMFKYMYLKDL